MSDRPIEFEIVVSKQMVDAGVEDLYEFRIGDDPRWLVEKIYRSMHYERLAASSTSDVKYSAASNATE